MRVLNWPTLAMFALGVGIGWVAREWWRKKAIERRKRVKVRSRRESYANQIVNDLESHLRWKEGYKHLMVLDRSSSTGTFRLISIVDTMVPPRPGDDPQRLARNELARLSLQHTTRDGAYPFGLTRAGSEQTTEMFHDSDMHIRMATQEMREMIDAYVPSWQQEPDPAAPSA